ncbi:protein O-mannosyl-transferase TMTC1-like [Galendromus occidentalis]|uniref:dolichyl-phosphate-mannose--protein mannosyltransferase n=1 Tax=Galendromus occidentalis TaxID=34638 RepID=A0AAJ7SHS5_9ACAR|nr:protein O-mannosyl-transferase TMTC1-like [Galendromus occidentalis]
MWTVDKDRKDLLWTVAVSAGVTILCFCFGGFSASGVTWSAAIDGDLVHDDVVAIIRNPDVVGSGTGWLTSIWTNDFWGTPMSSPESHKSYRPLTVLTFRLNYLFGGLRSRSYHVTNVVLHFICCVLLSTLAKCLTTSHSGKSKTAATAHSSGKAEQTTSSNAWSENDSLFLRLALVTIFGVHPIHTEAVTSIVGRADVLCAVFYLASILCFIKSCDEAQATIGEFPHERNQRNNVRAQTASDSQFFNLGARAPTHLWLAMALGVMSMLSKEQGITVFGVLIVYRLRLLCKRPSAFHCSPMNQRNVSTRCSQIVNWFTADDHLVTSCVTLAGLFSFRVFLLGGSLPKFSEHDNPAAHDPHLLTRFLTYSYLTAFNIKLLLYPAVLSYDWQMGSVPVVHSVLDTRNLATVALLVCAGRIVRHETVLTQGIQCGTENGQPLFLVAVALLCLPYIPASNLFVTVGFVVAERILYIPSMGFCLMLVEGFRRLLHHMQRSANGRRCIEWNRRQKFLVLILILWAAVAALRTVRRNVVWTSREALFESGVRELPTNCKMHYNFANMMRDIGRRNSAIEHYQKAVDLCPNHASAHNNLGTVVASQSEAEKHFRLAININLEHAGAHYNLAMLYRKRGQLKLARALLERSLALDSSLAEALSSLADLEGLQGQSRLAENLHRKAIQLNGQSAPIRNNYGTFLQSQGRLLEASEQYKQAIALEPDNTVAVVNAAETMKFLRADHEAEKLYKRALALESDPEVMDQLAVLYVKSERFQEAQTIFEEILSIHPGHLPGRLHYSQMLMRLGHMDAAEEILQETLNRNAGFRDGLRQLALLYSFTNRTMEASEWIQKAIRLCPEGAAECAPLHADYGDILKDMSNLNRSAECYVEAIKLQPDLSHAHINLGVIRHLQGDFSSAFHHYTIAYSLDPNNTLVVENMEKLRKRILKSFRQHSTTIDAAFEMS